MQHIKFDRSIQLSNLVCLNQTRILHFDISSLLLTEQLCIDFTVTLKKNIPFNLFILLGKCLQEQAFHSCNAYFLCVLIRLSEEQTSPIFIWRHAKKNVCKETLSFAKMAPRSHPCCIHPFCLWNEVFQNKCQKTGLWPEFFKKLSRLMDRESKPQPTGGFVTRMRHGHSQF